MYIGLRTCVCVWQKLSIYIFTRIQLSNRVEFESEILLAYLDIVGASACNQLTTRLSVSPLHCYNLVIFWVFKNVQATAQWNDVAQIQTKVTKQWRL